MRLLALLAAGLFAGILVAAPVPKEKEKPKDEDAILGTWEVVKTETGGDQPLDPPAEGQEERWVFDKGGKLTMTQGGKVLIEQTFKLDPAAKPKALDLTTDGGGAAGEYVYELDGDTLKVCFQWGVKIGSKPVRPDAVKADQKRIFMLMTLKRVTDEKKDK